MGAVAAALLLLGSAQPAWSKEKADKAAPPEVVRGVPRVVDGDTLAIDTRRIRLFGVDAPEKAQSCQRHKGKGSYSCGMDSQHALEEHLKGQTVACEVQRLDQYGRSVAACTLPNGEDLSAWLVQSGNAVAYRKYSGEKYVALETEAKKAERGIWASDFTMPAEYRRQHHKHGG